MLSCGNLGINIYDRFSHRQGIGFDLGHPRASEFDLGCQLASGFDPSHPQVNVFYLIHPCEINLNFDLCIWAINLI